MTLAQLLAGVYARCSDDKNDEASISEQAEVGIADCQANGWAHRLYDADNNRSASRFARTGTRPGWDQLMADLRAGSLGIIWLWESSRGDRKLADWAALLDECRDRGVLIHVHTHRRTYDLRIARDWKVMAEDGVDSAYEPEKTSLRVKRDLAAAAAKGRPHGPADYGYARRYHPVTRAYITQEPDPPASDVVAEIVTRAARSEPLKAIAADLDARGVPTPKNAGRWNRKTIRNIAMNPGYTGHRRTGDGDLVKGWEPIVPLELHQAAIAVLGQPGRTKTRPGRQRHLLSYLAACGQCGALLSVRSGHSALRYRCPPRDCVYVDAAWLDELVTIAVCDTLAAPDAAELFRADGGDAARHRAESARLRTQLDEWAAAAVSPRAYQIKEAQLLPKIDRAERAARAAEIPLALRDLIGADNVRGAWDGLEVAAQRDVIRALMDVRVAKAPDRTRAARTDPGRVLIAWRHA